MTFKELGLHHFILRALSESGYEVPTPIQTKAIPNALEGHDILGLAQTGSGKTAAFVLPILQNIYLNRIDSKTKPIRALIVSPTRELAIQIQESVETYGKHLPLNSTVIYGGVKQGNQERAVKKGIDILVATPGRLIDFINQGIVDISQVETFVLDEADRMLDMGFIHDIRKIIKSLPKKKQTMLFSATMPEDLKEIVRGLLHSPITVSVNPVHQTVDTIKQFGVYVDNNHKIDYLVDYIRENTQEAMLLFTRTKHGSDKVVKQLKKQGITALAIHGDKSQKAREIALDKFKNYEIQILVATDIASRGIDINELSYVVNYDIPSQPETYVHRIGRTGRAGNSGTAISLISYGDIEYFKDIEKHIKQKIEILKNDVYPLVDKKNPRNKQNSKRESKGNAQSDDTRDNTKRSGGNIKANRIKQKSTTNQSKRFTNKGKASNSKKSHAQHKEASSYTKRKSKNKH